MTKPEKTVEEAVTEENEQATELTLETLQEAVEHIGDADPEQITPDSDVEVDQGDAPELKDFPVHMLHEKLDDMGIVWKESDKRDVLISMITTGKSIHRGVRRRVVATLPKAVARDIEAMEAKGLKYEIDPGTGGVTFMRDVTTFANLDQSAKQILFTAKQAFAQAKPTEMGAGGKAPWER